MSGPTRLLVVLGSTRPGRTGLPVWTWFCERAARHPDVEVDPVDLADVDLPHLDEPELPRFGRYEQPHTRAWAGRVAAADAVVLVTPEYNHAPSPVLLGALDALGPEWRYAPVGFVSYGGVAAGARAVQVLGGVVVPLRMVRVADTVALPFVHEHVRADGTFDAPPTAEAAADAMLSELHRLAGALRPLRRPPG
ncbi:NAD(P)H-dependent oxidoreductase [Angustibacter speluncae]